MKKEDEWIKEFDSITVNSIKYWFRCEWSFEKKAPNEDKPSTQLIFNIYKDGEGWIKWEDMKGSYFSEKFTDYIKNTLNGQRAIYWDTKEKRSF